MQLTNLKNLKVLLQTIKTLQIAKYLIF